MERKAVKDMTAREKLEELHFLTNRMCSARFAVEKAMARATKVNSPIEPRYGGGSSVKGSVTEEGAIALIEAKEAFAALKNRIRELREWLEPIVDTIEDYKVRAAMKSRYMDGLSVRSIAYANYYSERHVQRLLKTGEQTVLRVCGDGDSKAARDLKEKGKKNDE